MSAHRVYWLAEFAAAVGVAFWSRETGVYDARGTRDKEERRGGEGRR
jgi:hypothetical protein